MNGLWGISYAFIWLIVIACCCLGWQLLRQNGRILVRLDELEKRIDAFEFGEEAGPEGLPLDSVAPDFELPDLEGKSHALAEYRGQALLLIFFNPACGFCRDLVPKLKQNGELAKQKAESAAEGSSNRPLILVVSTGGAEANRQLFNDHKTTTPVLLQKEMEVASAYKANGTPVGYLISAEGKIGSELAVGAEALLALAEGGEENARRKAESDSRVGRFANRSLARSKIKRDGLKAGTPAPNFKLPRLDGRGDLSLEELRGQRVLLVFSDPHCGPCQMLAPDLEKFHRAHSDLALVMISRGDPKENRAKVKEHGLTFPIVLQQQWEISRLYAMFATPVGYLIDQTGVVAKDVAVGTEPIQALLTEAAKSA